MVLRASGEQEGRTCTTRKTSRTIDSEIDYGLSRLANGKLRQGKAKSGNKQKPIPRNRATYPKAKQYYAPHPCQFQSPITSPCLMHTSPKPIPELEKVLHVAHVLHVPIPSAKREALRRQIALALCQSGSSGSATHAFHG